MVNGASFLFASTLASILQQIGNIRFGACMRQNRTNRSCIYVFICIYQRTCITMRTKGKPTTRVFHTRPVGKDVEYSTLWQDLSQRGVMQATLYSCPPFKNRPTKKYIMLCLLHLGFRYSYYKEYLWFASCIAYCIVACCRCASICSCAGHSQEYSEG